MFMEEWKDELGQVENEGKLISSALETEKRRKCKRFKTFHEI